MKKTAILCLCAFAAFLSACGGSDQGTATNESLNQDSASGGEGTMSGPPATAAKANMPQYPTPEEGKKYLTDNYTDEKLKEIFLELTAVQQAEVDYSGSLEDEAAEMRSLQEGQQRLNAAIERAGINNALFTALTMMSTEKKWFVDSDFQAAVKARAKEINAAR